MLSVSEQEVRAGGTVELLVNEEAREQWPRDFAGLTLLEEPTAGGKWMERYLLYPRIEDERASAVPNREEETGLGPIPHILHEVPERLIVRIPRRLEPGTYRLVQVLETRDGEAVFDTNVAPIITAEITVVGS